MVDGGRVRGLTMADWGMERRVSPGFDPSGGVLGERGKHTARSDVVNSPRPAPVVNESCRSDSGRRTDLGHPSIRLDSGSRYARLRARRPGVSMSRRGLLPSLALKRRGEEIGKAQGVMDLCDGFNLALGEG